VTALSTALALFGLAVFAAWPLLRAGATTVIDGTIHFYRLAELHWALQNGSIYPRWLPDFAYGFGVPTFNFYPPLSYWAAEVWALLGLPLSRALEAGYFLALLTLLLGAYLWARAVFRSEVAALASAASYGLCPYLFVNLLRRGAYPELWGMALAPWVLLAVVRLARNACTRSMLILAATVAVQVLTHPLSAFMLIPFLPLYLVGLIRVDWRRWLWAAGALLLAAGLAAICWFPALAEESFVQMSRTVSHPLLDFHNHFLSLSALLGSPYVLDPLRIFMPMQPSLSWLIVTLALVGWWAQRRRLSILAIGVIALTMVFLVTPASMVVWESVPKMPMVQFPWRFVGPLSLLVAMLAGGGVAALKQRWVLPIFVLGVALFSMGWMFGYPAASLEGKTNADIPAFERKTGLVGSTVFGEFLTVWMPELPSYGVFENSYAARELPPPRLDVASLPPGVQVLHERPQFDSTSIEYETNAPFDARLHWLIFPDVRAEVDGVSLRVGPEPGTGLVLVSGLPAGRHTFTVQQVLSGPQRIGTVISLASLVILVGGWLLARRTVRGRRATPLRWQGISVALVAAGLIALRVTWLDVRPSPFYRSSFDGKHVEGAEPRAVDFGAKMRLVGLRVNERKNEVRLYWQPLQKLIVDYSTALYLEDAEGYRYGQKDSQHPGEVPTTRWGVQQYADDVHALRPLPGTPPGEYRLVTSVYSADGGLDVLTPQGPAGHYVDVGVFTVPRAGRPPSIAELAPQVVSERSFGDFILLGYDIDRPAVEAGTPFYVTLYWQATRVLPAGTLLELILRRGDEVLASVTAPLTTRTVSWVVDEVGRGPLRLPVPAETPPGKGMILLRLGGREMVLGEIDVAD